MRKNKRMLLFDWIVVESDILLTELSTPDVGVILLLVYFLSFKLSYVIYKC